MPFADPVAQKAYWRDYARKHGARYRRYRRVNRERISQLCVAWRKKNRARCRALQKSWRKANPEKVAAGNTLRRAIYAGLIRRQPCEICRDPLSQAHHDDYSRPFKVRWLCATHHYQENRRKKVKEKH